MVHTFLRKQHSDSDNSAIPYLASPWHMLAFPWHALRIYSICKVNATLYSNDNKQFVFVLLKNPNSASKIPKRLRQCNHSAAIWINGEDESRITFLHAF